MNYVIALSVISILAAAGWLHSYLLRHRKYAALRVRASKFPDMRLGRVYHWKKRDPS